MITRRDTSVTSKKYLLHLSHEKKGEREEKKERGEEQKKREDEALPRLFEDIGSYLSKPTKAGWTELGSRALCPLIIVQQR